MNKPGRAGPHRRTAARQVRWRNVVARLPAGPTPPATPRPFPGVRRVISPLGGFERLDALGFVARASNGLQSESEANLRMYDVLRRLELFGRPKLARRFRPCFDAGRVKRLRSRPFDCFINESAACAYCQLEAQLRLVQWIRQEARFNIDPISVTVSQQAWRRKVGKLRFDLRSAMHRLKLPLDPFRGDVVALGRFEFGVGSNDEGARWRPHAHLLMAGERGEEALLALHEAFDEVERPVVARPVWDIGGWTSYINKGAGIMTIPFVRGGKSSSQRIALRPRPEVELFEYLSPKTINDLIFRHGIDLPRSMTDMVGG